MIKATVNQSIYEVKEGTTLSDLAKQVQKPQEPIILLAYMDGKVKRIIYSYDKRLSCAFCDIKRTGRVYGI